MAKISLLKSQILRKHLSYEDPTLPTVRAIMTSLHDWHNQLPREMTLHSVDDIPEPMGLKVTICYTHLLYLGATMLLYRRIVTQHMQSLGISGDYNVRGTSLEQAMRSFVGDAVTAATRSVRILTLLREDNGIFQRCWLVM